MWPFTKKQPIIRILCREVLEYKMKPCFGAGGMGTEVDTFAVWAVTYQDVETGKTFVKREEELIRYHPDHPLCQDGQVLWEFPEEDESQTRPKTGRYLLVETPKLQNTMTEQRKNQISKLNDENGVYGVTCKCFASILKKED